MRNPIVYATAFASLIGTAGAQEMPVDPYAAPLPPPAVVEAPAAPPADYPVTPQPAQPVIVEQPAPVQQPGYYYPPTGYAAPIYSYPPPPTYYVAPARPRRERGCSGGWCTAQQRGPYVKWFSLGARLTALAVDQQINGQDVVLGGAGLQLRMRSRGRFGFEASADFLHGSFGAPPQAAPSNNPGGTSGPYFHVADVTRDSIPVSLSLMLYIFPNAQQERVFNLYFLGGVGGIATTMGLTDENGNAVKQNFWEWEAHLGVGAELRFKWIALQADVRGLGLARDDKKNSGAYYNTVDGAPVPQNSLAVQGNVGATIWF